MYKVSWTLINIGKKTWDSGVKVVFVEGAKLSAEKVFSLKQDVKPKKSITTLVNILTPPQKGNYRGVWGLRLVKTNRLFCMFTVKVTVP